MIDFVQVEGEGGFERYAIRAWASRESRWVQYEMDSPDPTLTSENDGTEETRAWSGTSGRTGG